jgi:hypothetical protein
MEEAEAEAEEDGDDSLCDANEFIKEEEGREKEHY